jgi:hypothetical protein
MRLLRKFVQLGIVAAGLVVATAAQGYANTPIIDPAYNSRIIDDYIFTNSSTMSVADIQGFLNAKVPVCDSYHKNSDGTTPSTPYICLKDYVDSTSGKTAAQLIYDEANGLGMNPQVLLVTLQKEQSLVTDTWPYPSQYKSAMGYGCPESQSVCDAQYYGFYNQVHLGAKLLRVGHDRACGNNLSYPGWTVGSQWVRGNTVTIDTRDTGIGTCATASLYNYTPHRPDSAYTLVNSTTYYYGNYNFINFFNNWFTTTWAGDYINTYLGQSSYPSLPAGGTTTVYIRYRNSGNKPWYDDTTAAGVGAQPVHLATSHPINRSSQLASGWAGSNNRPNLTFSTVYHSDGTAYSGNPHVVSPGESVQYSFGLSALNTLAPGTYREYFQPIVEGGSTMNDAGTFLDVSVTPTYLAQYYDQSAYPTLLPGQTANGFLRLKNTGNLAWNDSTVTGQPQIYLATANPTLRASQFGLTWGTGKNKPSTTFGAVYEADGVTLGSNQHMASAGQIVKFPIAFTARGDAGAGTYREWFRPLISNNSTINDIGAFLDVTVQQANYYSQYRAQSAYPTIIGGNGPTQAWVEYTNTGNMPWFDDASVQSATAGTRPIHLATSHAINRRSATGITWGGDQNRPTGAFAVVYDDKGNPYGANPRIVAPGESVRFNFQVAANPEPTVHTYREFFQPIVEGGSLMNDPWTFMDVTVTGSTYYSEYVSEAAWPSLGAVGSQASVYLTYRNTGNLPWYDDISIASAPAGIRPVHLATSHAINRRDIFGSTWGGDQNRATGQFSTTYHADGTLYSTNPHVVAPGESAQFSFTLSRPAGFPNGFYYEFFQPIVEGGSLMNDPWTFLGVTLR